MVKPVTAQKVVVVALQVLVTPAAVAVTWYDVTLEPLPEVGVQATTVFA